MLRGTREEWTELLRRNDEGVGLKDLHVGWILDALGHAPPDEAQIEIDVMLGGMRQIRERAPRPGDIAAFRHVVATSADRDESWWIHRARTLGLLSIVPVEPWPRVPGAFYRPPDYLHTYGVNNPELEAAMHKWIEYINTLEPIDTPDTD